MARRLPETVKKQNWRDGGRKVARVEADVLVAERNGRGGSAAEHQARRVRPCIGTPRVQAQMIITM